MARGIAIFLMLSLGALTVYSQGSCQTSTVSGNACGEYSNGCPGATFFSSRGDCKESFELVDNAKCCCGCPKKQVDRHHCVVKFYADPYLQYKSPQNVIGFCQDQKHFIARDPDDLFSYEQYKAAQEKIIKDINAFYAKASGKQNTMPFKEMGGRAKVQKNSQGITYWEFKTKEGVEQIDAKYNVIKSCPSAGASFRPASCVLQKQNPCKSSLQGQFEVSNNTWYDPRYPVRREPTWNVWRAPAPEGPETHSMILRY